MKKRTVSSSAAVSKLREYKVTYQECWDLYRDHLIVKLDWNESGVSPSPRVKKALTRFIENSPLNWYPDVEARELRVELAKYVGLPIEYSQVFSGSDAALEYVARAFIDNGDEVVMQQPTYDNFRVYAESCGAVIRNVFGDDPFRVDMEKLLGEITAKTKIFYLVNPDNPTGRVYSRQEIIQILEKAPHALVIVDEAYYEFYGETMADLIKEYPNLLVSRSFSKAFGLAGLRCGYLLSHPDNLAAINKIRVGKNVSSLAQLAALTALEDVDYMKRYVRVVNEAKSWTVEQLQAINIKVVNTPANFIVVEVENVPTLLEFLRENNVYVRDRSYMPQMSGMIRISVGTRAQMEKVVEMFRRFAEVEDDLVIYEQGP